MSLIDWLRKLAILRFGAEGAVYHNAAGRPAGLLLDGVYASQKELEHLDRQSKEADSSHEAESADAG